MGPLELTIDQLLLDHDNPRIASASSQRDALVKILSEPEKLAVLADSIIQDGMSPIDRLLVARAGKNSRQYIALEGNRRLAALKVLANPNVLTDLDVRPSVRKRFSALADRFDASRIEPISCYETTRAASKKWIELRHTGENAGKGVVRWDGIMTARFRGEDAAQQVLDLVRAHGGLSKEDERTLEGFKISTLKRLTDSPDVCALLGLETDDGVLVSRSLASDLIKPLRQIVVDIANRRQTSRTLQKKEHMIDYVKSLLPPEKVTQLTPSPARPIKDIAAGSRTPKPVEVPRGRRLPDPSSRKALVPKQLRLAPDDNKAAELLRELRKLDVEDYPHAVAVLFRVFLEVSVDHFMDAHLIPLRETDKGGHERDKTLARKIRDVVDHMVARDDARAKDFNAVLRAVADPRNPLAIERLHDYVHNRFTFPNKVLLIGAWNEAQRLIEKIWG